jgi:hypothetical protein
MMWWEVEGEWRRGKVMVVMMTIKLSSNQWQVLWKHFMRLSQ